MMTQPKDSVPVSLPEGRGNGIRQTTDDREYQVKAEGSLTLNLTWSKVIFVCGTIFLMAILLVGTLAFAVWLGHSLQAPTAPPPATSPVSQNATKAAPAAFVVPMDIRRDVSSLQEAFKAFIAQREQEKSSVDSLVARIDSLDAKLEQSKLDSAKSMSRMLSSAFEEWQKINATNKDELAQAITMVLDNKLTKLQLSNSPLSKDETSAIMAKLGDIDHRLDQMKTRVTELATVCQSLQQAEVVLPAPKDSGIVLASNPKDRMEQLFGYAGTFVEKYEKTDSEASKKWKGVWETMVVDRSGDRNRAANERLMSVLMSLKKKTKNEITAPEIYEACRIFLTYKEPTMQLPTFALAIMKSTESPEYAMIIDFIREAMTKIK